jgi:hypothetical protein
MAKKKEETKKGLLSSIFGKKEKKKETSPTKEGVEQKTEEPTVGSNVLPFLDLIAKQSLAFPGMARDVNVLRQNIAKLVKIKGETAATKADKFFKSEDQRESELEATRSKSKAATPATEKGGKEAAPKEEGGIGGLLSMLNPVKLIGGLITGIVGGFASLFSGGSILALLSKIFVPAMLIGGLINGILDGIKVWKESGSIIDTLVAALGGFLKFITFGLFGEKELRQGMDSALKMMMPLLLGVTELFDKVVGWMKNNVGFPGLKVPLAEITTFVNPLTGNKVGPLLKDLNIPPYYPFKKDTGSTKEEKYESSATKSLKEMGTKLDSGEGVFYDKAAKDRLEDKPKEKEKQEKQKASQQALAETVGKSPTPDPYSPVNAEKSQDAAKGFLSSKVGINVDPSSSTGYTDQASGKPVSEEEVRRKVIAVGGEPTKILQMAKGASTSPAPAAPATGGGDIGGASMSTGGATGGAVSAGGAAPSSPMPTPAMSAPSGSAISSDSATVAEGQRMDAAADAGTIVNAPTTSTTSGQQAPSSESVADPYNSSFMNNYLAA